jgi:hypothetical protein
MSDLNWDDVLGTVEKDEAENPSSGGGDFEALPKGPYEVVVQEADKQVASTGKDMIKVRVQVVSGPYANRVLFNYIVFSQDNPKAMRLTLERLAAFGLTREFIATQKPSIPQIAELLVGRKATAVVGIQEKGDYAGRNEIKAFRPLEGAAQPTPTVAAPKPAGVPNIPTPEASAPAPTPVVPVPQVPVAAAPADAADPFEG